jgi:hypothetical protein
MVKFEFSKQLHVEHNKVKLFVSLKFLNDLGIKTMMHFHEVITANLDGCVHISCANVIYKHVHMVLVNGAKTFC